MPEFEVRVASPSDYKQIKRLCMRAVGSDDYVIPILKRVISRKGLFLAFKSDELVGMSNLARTLDNAGWFGMARTDPDWRRKGVAISLQRAKAEYAKSRGINRLRLFVLSTNTPSLRACLKGGFRPVCESAHLSLKLPQRRKKVLDESLRRDPERLLDSTYLSKMNGYLGYQSIFVAVNRGVLEEITKLGELHSTKSSTFILNRQDELEMANHREFSLLVGAFGSGLKSVISLAGSLHVDSVGSFIPYERYLITTARRMGFMNDPWGWHSICLEKRI